VFPCSRVRLLPLLTHSCPNLFYVSLNTFHAAGFDFEYRFRAGLSINGWGETDYVLETVGTPFVVARSYPASGSDGAFSTELEVIPYAKAGIWDTVLSGSSMYMQLRSKPFVRYSAQFRSTGWSSAAAPYANAAASVTEDPTTCQSLPKVRTEYYADAFIITTVKRSYCRCL
jgi:hypothetical protein